ncbi:hypothetical protein PanWU01x14_227940, partial [Parasponia andersonii]
ISNFTFKTLAGHICAAYIYVPPTSGGSRHFLHINEKRVFLLEFLKGLFLNSSRASLWYSIRLIKRILHPVCGVFTMLRFLLLLSNGSRFFHQNLKDLGIIFPDFGNGFRHIVGEVHIKTHISPAITMLEDCFGVSS